LELSRSTIERLSALQATVDDVHHAVCRDIVDKLKSSRASIWYFNDSQDALTNVSLLDSRTEVFESGAVLKQHDFAPYFAAIKSSLCIRASEAAIHPATQCFTEAYFKPLGIVSLLDFIITVRGKPVAVLCCEQCDQIRNWTDADEEYLHQMAILLSLSIMIGRQVPA
jgi:GAF domain-containing protein